MTVEKTVTILGYMEDYGGYREYMSEHSDEDIDWFAEDVEEYTNYFLKTPTGRISLSKEDFNELHEKDTGELVVIKEEETRKEYRCNSMNLGRNFFDNKVGEDIRVGGLYLGGWKNGVIYHDDLEESVGSVYKRMVNKKLVKHQSDIEDEEDIYEGEERMPAIRIKLKVNMDKEYLGEFNNLVNKVYRDIANTEGIGRVRTYNCEVKEKGVCYNI